MVQSWLAGTATASAHGHIMPLPDRSICMQPAPLNVPGAVLHCSRRNRSSVGLNPACAGRTLWHSYTAWH